MKPAPIALFVYNRLWHTRKTVESLLQNKESAESELSIFSDGPKDAKAESQVTEVREFLNTIRGFKSVEIFQSDKNMGLAKSIISGVTRVLEKNDNIIVVEDDLVTSPHFLDYMNQGLHLYEHEEKVISIHGYIYPVQEKLPETFFLRGADCWGWATWKRGWALFEPDGRKLLEELKSKGQLRDFDFDGTYPYSKMLSDQIAGRNDSWAIRWYASAFLKEKLTLYPGVSMVFNIGFDRSGTHTGSTKKYDVELRSKSLVLERIPVQENASAKAIVANYFRKLQSTGIRGVARKIKRLFSK